MNKGGCKVGKKSDLGGCKIGKKNPPAKKKPKFKVKAPAVAPVKKKPKFKVKPAVVAPVKKKPKFKVKPENIILGEPMLSQIKLISLKEYRGGLKTAGFRGDGLTEAQARLSKGNMGSFVLLDTKTGKIYNNKSDYKKKEVAGETRIVKYKKPGGSRATKREGLKIEALGSDGEFVKTPGTGYNYSWIGNMYESRNV